MDAAVVARRLYRLSWAGVPARVAELREKLAAQASALQLAVGGTLTTRPIGLYADERGRVAFWFPAQATGPDRALVKAAALTAVNRTSLRPDALSLPELASGQWIKVAFSPALRTLGEWTNFFPGQYPGGAPNHPGALSAMLTSGALGAGLGYGTGAILERVLPDNWRRGKLRKLLAVLGAAPGIALGGLGAIQNLSAGRPVNSPGPFGHAAPGAVPGVDFVHPQAAEYAKLSQDSAGLAIEIHPRHRAATESFCKRAFGETGVTGPGATVRLNDLGQVLYEGGVTGPTRHAILAAAAVASQLPGSSGPGTVNPHQFGQLAQRMGGGELVAEGIRGGVKGYLGGVVAGSALGLLGAPGELQDWLRSRGAMAGVAAAILPHLLGQ